jgi:hypothetical protein
VVNSLRGCIFFKVVLLFVLKTRLIGGEWQGLVVRPWLRVGTAEQVRRVVPPGKCPGHRAGQRRGGLCLLEGLHDLLQKATAWAHLKAILDVVANVLPSWMLFTVSCHVGRLFFNTFFVFLFFFFSLLLSRRKEQGKEINDYLLRNIAQI